MNWPLAIGSGVRRQPKKRTDTMPHECAQTKTVTMTADQVSRWKKGDVINIMVVESDDPSTLVTMRIV